MKWLARVPSRSLLLFKVQFIINVGEKEMDPFIIKKQRTMSQGLSDMALGP
jgi:hypothetical protein